MNSNNFLFKYLISCKCQVWTANSLITAKKSSTLTFCVASSSLQFTPSSFYSLIFQGLVYTLDNKRYEYIPYCVVIISHEIIMSTKIEWRHHDEVWKCLHICVVKNEELHMPRAIFRSVWVGGVFIIVTWLLEIQAKFNFFKNKKSIKVSKGFYLWTIWHSNLFTMKFDPSIKELFFTPKLNDWQCALHLSVQFLLCM